MFKETLEKHFSIIFIAKLYNFISFLDYYMATFLGCHLWNLGDSIPSWITAIPITQTWYKNRQTNWFLDLVSAAVHRVQVHTVYGWGIIHHQINTSKFSTWYTKLHITFASHLLSYSRYHYKVMSNWDGPQLDSLSLLDVADSVSVCLFVSIVISNLTIITWGIANGLIREEAQFRDFLSSCLL